MAPPIASWTLSDGTTAATPWSFTDLAPSSPSAWQTRYLWNNRAGASPVDSILNGKLRVLARVQGDTVWLAAGLVALDTRSIEVEILGGSVGSGIEARSPVRIGAGAWLDLPEIPDGEAVHIRARVSLPGTAGETALELDFYPDLAPAEALPNGLWESAGGGVRLGIGDGSCTHLLGGGPPAASGTPDDVVTLPDLAWVHLGVPRAALEDAVTLDDTDGAAATLGAGEAYRALFSLGVGGAATLTKGLKALLANVVDPATPAAELAYARVMVDDSGTIEQADIELLAEPWGFPVTADGLNAIAGPGEALVGGRLVRTMTPSQETVAASATSTVWLLPDGSLESTADGSRPADRALALAQVDADATDIIPPIRDLRPFFEGRAVRAQFVLPAPVVSDVAYWVNGSQCRLYVRPIAPILFSLVEDPADLTPTAGSWKVDLEVLQTDFTWLTLFTSNATDDRRPAIPFGTSSGRDASALPEVLLIPPGGVLRCRVVSLATSTTPASALLLSLMLEAPLG